MTHGDTTLTVDRNALGADLDALAGITDPARHFTRRSFSPLFLEGRKFLGDRFAELGLAVRIDAAGNLIGHWQGTEPAAGVILTGSHSDTVPDGGRFDGIAGIVSSLAAVRTMKTSGITPRHSIEVVDFLAEEPSEWGLSCIGSRGMAGALGAQELALTGPGGERLDAAIRRMGGEPSHIETARRSDIAAFFELHIEQGPVLEAERIPVGVVTAIAGIARVKVRFQGEAGHAGTVPMRGRRDAGLAMARFVLSIRNAALEMIGVGHLTATTGVLTVEPGGANVIPGAAETLVDIRAEDDAAMSTFLEDLRGLAERAAKAEACELARFTIVSRTNAARCDRGLQAELRSAAAALGLVTRALASGAGHDAAFMARIAPAAMLFVPCQGGRSHCPEEFTEPDQLAAGADVLLNAIVARDTAPDSID